MSNSVVPRLSNGIVERDFSSEEIQLIKATVAKGATDPELKLFLYRCKNMGLDPLKPGMVHFIKYGSNPGSIVVGIEGFRAKAARTGQLAGIKRGVLRDESGKCVGGWCEVYRHDWTHPAREEVPLSEYNTGKSQWAKMPETMVKKVAEAAALRMAFADELGGVYAEEELNQSDVREVKAREITEKVQATDATPEFEGEEFETAATDVIPQDAPTEPPSGEFKVKFKGRYLNRRLKEISKPELVKYRAVLIDSKSTHIDVKAAIAAIDTYLEEAE